VKLLSRVLRTCGVDAIHVTAFNAVIPRLQQLTSDKPAAFVFLDALIRGLDGPRPIAQLRAEPRLAGARFVVAAPLSSKALVELRAARGADEWLATQSGLLQIEATVREWLREPEASPQSARSSRSSNPQG